MRRIRPAALQAGADAVRTLDAMQISVRGERKAAIILIRNLIARRAST